MDVAQFTAKERKQARKDLLKKIDLYNKQVRKTRSSSFPMSSPSQDLVYKGIVKVTYDRGYALQTKSLLLENTTSAAEAVVQLFDALGLRGRPSDYALEERNIMNSEIRLVGRDERPLNLQLNYGPNGLYMELRLVQIKDTLAAPPLSTFKVKRSTKQGDDSENDNSDEDPHSDSSIIVPKEEVTDHGIASVELVMEEALQDIPPLVYDVQERLKSLSESVAVDGKPRTGLPNRRMLWDALKPQASSLVKDIRRLVDNGEFLANKHSKSPVVKLVVTLLLELVTDHSRELVTVTKEMCGLRGAAKTEFNSSVSLFAQQITYISKLVGKTKESLHAMALTGHLLEVTNPDNFQSSRLMAESYFTGSSSVSGVLLFTVVSAYLGLIRAGYEEKQDFFASLATNMLRSAQRALETIQKTNEYSMLHLHPLRSRVRDMEHKLKVAMDNLIRGVKLASSSRPPPDATSEMLLFGHSLTMATLDFLMVAQCASLVHKVVIAGWEILQFPWVRALAEIVNPEGKSDGSGTAASFADQLSSLGSDSTSSQSTGTDSNSYHRGSTYPGVKDKGVTERRSRVPTQFREGGDVMVTTDVGTSTKELHFSQLGITPGTLNLESYTEDSGNEADDERAQSIKSQSTPLHFVASASQHYVDTATDTESQHSTVVSTSASVKRNTPSGFELEASQYTGIDAVKKLRTHYNINKAIAKGAESLLLTVTQKINILSLACRDMARDRYSNIVELILGAAKQIRDEVSTMEVDLLVGENILESLKRTKSQMESVVREVHLVTLMASNSTAPENSEMKLMSTISHLREICSKTVADALSTASEHKKALEQAEKIEKEFVSLMTGHRSPSDDQPSHQAALGRKYSSPARMSMTKDSDVGGIVFEESKSSPLVGGSISWAVKEAPKVMGGTVNQLVQRLTSHRVIDSEFAETFILTFYTFMSPETLLDSLIDRYNTLPVADLSVWEKEMFETDVLYPIRLRVVHTLRIWLRLGYSDFQTELMYQKLQRFLEIMQQSMPSSAKQLNSSLIEHMKSGPTYAHHMKYPKVYTPTPLVPIRLSTEHPFDLLEVNTLELARQLTLSYADSLKHITSQELLSVGWTNESKHHMVPNILNFLQLSKNITTLIHKEVLKESVTEDQVSVLSYFIQTAKSCLELRNYEGVFTIVGGLQTCDVNDSWQMVTDHLSKIYQELEEIASPDNHYQRYKEETQTTNQVPCIPRLSLILSDITNVNKETNLLPDTKYVINFQKNRHFAKVIQQLQHYQHIAYNLQAIEMMQKYLESLKNPLSEEELDKLTTKVEAFIA